MSKFYTAMRLSFTVVVSLFIALLGLYNGPAKVEAQNQKPLLSSRAENVNATSNVTLNFTMPSGFILSGTVKSADGTPVFTGSVRAQSGGQIYSGPIMFRGISSMYQIVLPAGAYSLSVESLALDPATGSALFITSDVPGMVTVMGNTTRDIALAPPPATVPISGNVTSAGTLPTEGGISFTSSDRKIAASVELDGSYSARLPKGTYDVAISLGDIQSGDEDASLILRMGMITVNGPQSFNFMLPTTVALSGTVKNSNGTPAVPSSVFAIDTNDLGSLPSGTVGCEGGSFFTFLATLGSASIDKDSTTGAYRLALPPRAYSVAVTLDLDPREEGASILSFPIPFLGLTLNADRTQNFVTPQLPPFVTISGKVTDATGQPVAGAIVSAFTSKITNTPNAAFSTAVETASDGSYQLRVLSGTEYTVLVCPPQPGGSKLLAIGKLNKAVETMLQLK
ncbi:MAG: carboxypeptidase regulatory-like domain-containing protein [Acidobacteria bacterium]|nr:carboxypeptidase regulatory-like domain-containing protein [Acidobacteriota bacterium]